MRRPAAPRRESTVCQAAHASATASLPGPRRRQRHAMLDDYIVTIPYGAATAVAGLISLPLKGGWIGLLTVLCGGLLFTLGSMSHDRTTAGQSSKSALTLAAALTAALLSRTFYNKAVNGVFGTMMATIVSAAVSLFLVYNVVLGGNKPQQGSSAPQTPVRLAKSNSTAATVHESPTSTRSWRSSTDQDSSPTDVDRPQETLNDGSHSAAAASELGSSKYSFNAQNVATVTGVVLYAQGAWGLWGKTLGYSPASMAAALGSGLILIGLAQTVLNKASKL